METTHIIRHVRINRYSQYFQSAESIVSNYNLSTVVLMQMLAECMAIYNGLVLEVGALYNGLVLEVGADIKHTGSNSHSHSINH